MVDRLAESEGSSKNVFNNMATTCSSEFTAAFLRLFVQLYIKHVEEKVVVIHRGRCNNKVYYRLSHDVVT